MDLGTGDGRLPWSWAQENADRLFVGIDANAAGLREFSGRALRVALANLVYVRAAVEDLPAELEGVADRLTVVLPWGSLLAAVARPSPEVLRGFRALCRLGARFTAVLAHDPVRDQAELVRLGLLRWIMRSFGAAWLATRRADSRSRRCDASIALGWLTGAPRGHAA